MEQVPNWLTDAVAAAGIAGVYLDYDTLIDKGQRLDLPVDEPPATH